LRGSIGVLLVLAQSLLSQERPPGATGGVGALTSGDEAFRATFERLLLGGADRDLERGWQLAIDVGRPAAPLLWEMVQDKKSNVGRRLVVLAAAVLAGGPGEDDRLFAWLDSQTTMLEERVMVGFLLAMGPRRSRPMQEFWTRCLGPARATQPILGIAARLASARFPGAEVGAPQLSIEDEPGLAAAAAFAGLPVPNSLAVRMWNVRNAPDRHYDLFWRGALLGGLRGRNEDPQLQAGLLEHAREVMELQSDPYAPVRAAAALLRARANDVRPDGPRPDWRMLQLLASEVRSAERLKPWLSAVPPGLNDEEPQRLAVCYVLSREPQVILAERQQWAGDARIRSHVAIALAVRLLGEASPQVIDVPLPEVPEWFFVRWASGASVRPEATFEDQVLETLAGLAMQGRLPRSVAHTALEETLWRWQSHPGLGVFENERLLIRDLMLLGSRRGGKYLPSRSAHKLYQPAGIDKDHEFFNVAVPLWDFLSRPRLPMPAEYRLR
jgi:hypothetical protein